MLSGVTVEYPRRHRLAADSYRRPGVSVHLILRALPGTSPFANRVLGDAIWAVACQQNERGQVRLRAACLMPDHLHLLVQPERADLSRWLNSFKSYTASVSHRHGHRGSLWQPSYFDRLLREGEFEATLKYVLENPLAAGLVESSEEWPWSAIWLDETERTETPAQFS